MFVPKAIRPTLICLAAGFFGGLFPLPGMGLEVIDDDGNRVILEQPATRIVSLAPSLTEMLFAAGAGDHIVGVVEYSDFPAQAAALPVIGRHDLLDLEAIVALQPDLVVAWKSGNPAAAVARLKRLGLTVYVAEPRELASIPLHLEKMATLAGTLDLAQPVVSDFNETLNRLRAEATSPTRYRNSPASSDLRMYPWRARR